VSMFSGYGMYFDRQGRPIDTTTWAAKIEDREYSVVAQHWVRGWMVSTVWIGLNHNFNPFNQGPPVIFETIDLRTEGRYRRPGRLGN
jgi:hypothetical protein